MCILQIAKVKDSINVPYCHLENHLPELIKLASRYEIVVFHCRFSAQRGPSAAEIFENEVTISGDNVKPRVLVLRGGFEKWHKLFCSNTELYESI